MFETKRLYIRNILETDLDDMLEYMSDEDVLRYDGLSVFDKESLAVFISDIIISQKFYAVILKENNKMIGHLFLGKNKPEHFNEYNVGYIFNPVYQNLGYCTEATKRIIRFAFDELKAHRLTAKCNPDNIASWKVMEKAGFIKEGLLRNRIALKFDKQGKPIYWDELVYGLLESDLR